MQASYPDSLGASATGFQGEFDAITVAVGL